MKRTTLADIAAYAGVSPAAASYYFRRKKRLSQELERKLEEAAKLMNYTPMHIRNRPQDFPNARLVNMCITIENKDISDDIYFLCMMNGALDCLAEQGYQLTVSRLVEGDEASREFFMSGLACSAGVILCNPRKDHRIEDELQKRNMPYVVLGSPEKTESAFYVDVDMQGVGFQAADYLLKKGHRRILFLNLTESMLQSQQRHDGFSLAYKQRGLAFNEADHIYASVSADICCRIVTRLFAGGNAYTAIVTSNEIQAQGIIRAMKELKIDIPSKLALFSMGGTMLGALTAPTLTTIDFDPHKNGYEAARLLLDILNGKRIQPFHLILPGNLVERDSTK